MCRKVKFCFNQLARDVGLRSTDVQTFMVFRGGVKDINRQIYSLTIGYLSRLYTANNMTIMFDLSNITRHLTSHDAALTP